MGSFRVLLSYDGRENVEAPSVDAEIWQAAVRQTISRYGPWRLPKAAGYARLGEDTLTGVNIVGTLGDYRLVAVEAD